MSSPLRYPGISSVTFVLFEPGFMIILFRAAVLMNLYGEALNIGVLQLSKSERWAKETGMLVYWKDLS
jgi:hypothetical protein